MAGWHDADTLITEIHDLLYRLGLKATIQGYFETSGAVYLVMERGGDPDFSIANVYQEISKLYCVDLDLIDLRIRAVIKKIWKRNPELMNYLAGENLRKAPTPRQFILMLCHYLFLRQRP